MTTLPTPIEVVLDSFESENQPYKKFIRLISVFESLLKYLAIISIQDFYRRGLDNGYPTVHAEICRYISRPSLGSWKKLLESSLGCYTNHREKLFISEIYPFYFQNSRYELVKTPHIQIMSQLIDLRNEYSGHGSALSDDESIAKINDYQSPLKELLEKTSFLARYPLVYVEKNNHSNEFSACKFHASRNMQYKRENIRSGDLKVAHLFIHNPKDDTYLDLHPLLTYQVCGAPVSGRGAEPSKCKVKKFFFFNSAKNKDHYDYLDYLQGHHHFVRADQLIEFQARFEKLNRKEGEWFENFIQNTNEVYIQRKNEEKTLDEFVATAKKRALVIIGEPGIGKTALLSQWSMEHEYARHFFREGNADSLDLSWVFDNLSLQITDQVEVRWTNPREIDIAVHRREFLKTLKLASEKIEKLVIVLDGLDELVRSGNEGDSLLKELPDVSDLPPNVYLVLSTRPELVGTSFFNNKFGPSMAIHGKIRPMDEDEVRVWLSHSYNQYEVLDNPNYIRAIVQKSEGNALYLKFLLDDIFDYRIQFGYADKLPSGVRSYYERILHVYKDLVQNKELELRGFIAELDGLVSTGTQSSQKIEEEVSKHLKEIRSYYPSWGYISQVLALLCSVKQPVSKQVLSGILDIGVEDVSNVLKVVRSVLLETEQHTYSIFHSGFREYFLELNLDLLTDQDQRVLLLPFVRARILDWCRNWQSHSDPYALRYVVAHLGEDLEIADKIFELAENADFLRRQSEIDVYLPVHTIESALSWAVVQDNCPKIVGLALKLAGQLEIAKISHPLSVLEKAGVKQATLVADLYEPKGIFIWYLLLAREILRSDGKDLAIPVLKQLQEKQIPFPVIHDAIYKEFNLLIKELLTLLDHNTFQTLWEVTGSSDSRVLDYLIRYDMIPTAIKLSQEIDNPIYRTDALSWIAVRQILNRQVKDALETIMHVDAKNRGEAWREMFAMQLLVDRLNFAERWFDDEVGIQISHDTAVDLAKIGDYSSALSIIRWCSTPDHIDGDLFDITFAFGSMHKVSTLSSLAANIRNRELREKLFCSIAMTEAKMGFFKQAVGTLCDASRYYGHHIDTIHNPAWRYVLEQYYGTTEMGDATSLIPKNDDYPSRDLFPRWAFSLVVRVLSGELYESLAELDQRDSTFLESGWDAVRNRRYYCFELIDLYCEKFGFTEETKEELKFIAKGLLNLQENIVEFLEQFNKIAEYRIKKTDSLREDVTHSSATFLFPSLIKEATETVQDSETEKQKNAMLLRIVELNLNDQNIVDADTFFNLMLPGGDSYRKAINVKIKSKTEYGDIAGALELAKDDKDRLEYICRILASRGLFDQALQIGEAKNLYEENVCTLFGFAWTYLNNQDLELAKVMVDKAAINLLNCQYYYYLDELLCTGDVEHTFLKWIYFDEMAVEWILREFVSSIISVNPGAETQPLNILLAKVLYRIAEYQYQKYWIDDAKVSIDESMNRLEPSNNNSETLDLVLEIVKLDVRLGKRDQASRLLQSLLLAADRFNMDDDLEFWRRDSLTTKQRCINYIQRLLSQLNDDVNPEELSHYIEYEHDDFGSTYGEEIYEDIVNSDYSPEEILIKIADWLDSWSMHNADDDIYNDMHSEGLDMLEILAKHFCRQGKHDLSVDIIQLIGNEYRRSRGYCNLALMHIENGSFHYAFDLLQKITIYQSEHFSGIAEAFVKQGAWEYFKKMIIPMSHYQPAAYACIRLLPDIYPEQFDDYMLAVLEAEQ